MTATTPVMDGYIRVSVVGGRAGERFQSPTQQRETIAQWAKLHGVRIAKYHQDLDQSGGTMDRPGLNALRQRIDAGKTQGIVVARIDRFARTLIGGLITIRELHEQGARVVSVHENIDPATPMGRAMLGLILLMAEWQRDQADEHLAASQARAAREGRYPGRPPYGYEKAPDGTTRVVPDEAEVVRLIYTRRAQGTGWRQIAYELQDAGVPTPTGSVQWNHSTLFGIVRNEAYLGVFRGMRGMRIENAWPPLVTQAEWDAANHVKHVIDNAVKHHDRMCANIARCANCRYVLSRTVNPEGFVSYGCTAVSCKNRVSIGAHVLDEHVTKLINERFQRTVSPRPEDDKGEGRRLRKALAAAERDLDQWVEDTEIKAVLGEATHRKGILARAQARDAARLEVERHEIETGVADFAALPASIDFRLEDLPWEARRELVRRFVHSVWARRSKHRGLNATRHVADRVLLVWRDATELPAVPGGGPHPGPLEW